MNTFKNKAATENEFVFSICFFDDIMEYCSENMFL